MNEMDELTRMRASVTAPPHGGKAQTALLEAISQERAALAGTAAPAHRRPARARGPLRTPRVMLAGGLSLMAAAALAAGLVAQSGQAGPGPSAAGLTVHELAYRSAAAAEAAPPVGPDQWVFRSGVGAIRGEKSHFRDWMTADGTKFSGNDGKVFPRMQLTSQADPAQGTILFAMGPPGPFPIKYSQLASLPTDPKELEHYLEGVPAGGWAPGSPEHKAFTLAGDLLTNYYMPPDITAAVLRAIGVNPAVTVDNHARDAAGRPGVGFALADENGFREEIVMDPDTFRFMAHQWVKGQSGDSQTIEAGGAYVQQELVSGPGVPPTADQNR